MEEEWAGRFAHHSLVSSWISFHEYQVSFHLVPLLHVYFFDFIEVEMEIYLPHA